MPDPVVVHGPDCSNVAPPAVVTCARDLTTCRCTEPDIFTERFEHVAEWRQEWSIFTEGYTEHGSIRRIMR